MLWYKVALLGCYAVKVGRIGDALVYKTLSSLVGDLEEVYGFTRTGLLVFMSVLFNETKLILCCYFFLGEGEVIFFLEATEALF
jgi:hypothetical protein